jgi:hypothetical protein
MPAGPGAADPRDTTLAQRRNGSRYDSTEKTKDEIAAELCGMTVKQWQQMKQRVSSDRTRGKRPAGTTGADTNLATWGQVADQMPLFTDDTAQEGGH